jgi:hypothetical protein
VRALPPGLVAAAAIAAGTGAQRPAFYLLLGAIPAAFAAGLTLFGDFVDGDSRAEDLDLMCVALHALALAFVLVAAASPRLAVASCVCALGSLGLAGVLRGAALVQDARRVPREVDQRLRGEQRPHRHREARDHAYVEESLARR